MCFTRGVRSAQRIADIQLQPPTHHQKHVLKIPYALLLTCIIGAKKKTIYQYTTHLIFAIVMVMLLINHYIAARKIV